MCLEQFIFIFSPYPYKHYNTYITIDLLFKTAFKKNKTKNLNVLQYSIKTLIGGEMISYDTEVLKEKSTTIKNNRDELDQVLSDCNNIMSDLDQVWQGNASQAYIEAWGEYRGILQETIDMLDAASTNMKNIVEAQEDLDGQIANKIRG